MSYFPLGFSKKDFFVVLTILVLLVSSIWLNLQVSLRKGRDIQRKNDIRGIHDALHAFQADFGFFPPSDDQGRIMACISDVNNVATDQFGNVIYESCEWGKDSLKDVFDPSYPPYLGTIPNDPRAAEGRTYYYEASDSRFQIYGALEGSDEPEFDESIVNRSLSCGNETCNFGRANLDTPLDKSVEAYENELRERYKYEQQ